MPEVYFNGVPQSTSSIPTPQRNYHFDYLHLGSTTWTCRISELNRMGDNTTAAYQNLCGYGPTRVAALTNLKENLFLLVEAAELELVDPQQ